MTRIATALALPLLLIAPAFGDSAACSSSPDLSPLEGKLNLELKLLNGGDLTVNGKTVHLDGDLTNWRKAHKSYNNLQLETRITSTILTLPVAYLASAALGAAAAWIKGVNMLEGPLASLSEFAQPALARSPVLGKFALSTGKTVANGAILGGLLNLLSSKSQKTESEVMADLNRLPMKTNVPALASAVSQMDEQSFKKSVLQNLDQYRLLRFQLSSIYDQADKSFSDNVQIWKLGMPQLSQMTLHKQEAEMNMKLDTIESDYVETALIRLSHHCSSILVSSSSVPHDPRLNNQTVQSSKNVIPVQSQSQIQTPPSRNLAGPAR